MNNRTPFRNRYLQLRDSIKPTDTAGLIARHDKDGQQISMHQPCSATIARIRAAMVDHRTWKRG